MEFKSALNAGVYMLQASINVLKKAAEWLTPDKGLRPAIVDAHISDPGAEAQTDAPVIRDNKNNGVNEKLNIDSPEQRYCATERFSVISAVYNVGRYLDQFFESLVNQTADFRSSLEVIVVDDGSTDNSAEICQSWVARFPGSIRYLKQANAGQGAARNHGLRYARNDWVTFIDPDDFISLDYFERMDRAIKQHANKSNRLRMLVANFIFYFEDTDVFQDTHPLRYRFAKGDVVVSASNPGKHMVLSVNNTVFWRRRLLAERLAFDSRIKPAFEDAHFVNRYMVTLGDADIAFLAGPKYYYRKRSDATSTLDTAWLQPKRYYDQLLYGSIGLIDYCLERKGFVPAFVQRTLFYDLSWHIRRLINNDPLSDLLTEDAVKDYLRLLHQIMNHVSKEVILEFDVANIWFYQKIGILSVFKNEEPDLNIVYCSQYDSIKCLLEIKHFSRKEFVAEEIAIDGVRIVPVYSSIRCHWLLDTLFVYERSLWIEIGDGKSITASIAAKPARLSVAGKQHHGAASIQNIVTALTPKSLDEQVMPANVIELRRAARKLDTVRKYGGCWILMDRAAQADDNAEHLYRFLSQEHPHIKIFFVLAPDTPDWTRLQEEGFHLLEFNSTEHKLALLNADHLVSSHADNYVFGDLGQKQYGDLLRYRFTFLQHGIIKDDLSRWLNTKNISCFVTTTKPEYNSIVEGKNYKFSAKEIVMTGLPRHDKLLSISGESEKIILIMPTWRNSIVGRIVGEANERELNSEFHDTVYAQSWGALVRSPELERLAHDKGYKIVFLPHANVMPYIEGFNFPAHVEVRLPDGNVSIQQLFSRAALMVTDFSSVAFEMACIGRPVIYYQFDSDTFFSGAHSYQKGYFDYLSDGFGPVCYTSTEVLQQLAQVIGNNCVPAPEYRKRIDKTFTLLDGQCCRRTFEAIVALDTADVSEQARIPALLDFARRTVTFGEWQDAYGAWQQLRGKDGVPEAEAVFSLAVCARKLGLIEECSVYLSEAEQHDLDRAALLREQAALAAALGQFERAVSCYERWRLTNVPAAADADFMADMARAARLAGDEAKAESLLSEMQDSEHPAVLWERAELASLQQGWEEAAQRWSVMVAHAGKPEARLKYAEALSNLEQVEAAREALAGLPWDGVPLGLTQRRAELAFTLLDWKAAVRAWSIVEASGEMTPDDWLKFAKAYRKRGDLALAEQALENGRDSTDERTLMQERALLLSAQARWPEAVEAWQAFLNRRDLSPNRDGWLYLARAQMNTGDLETALRTVRRFAKARGDTEESLALRTEIGLAMGQAPSTTAHEDADRPEERGGAQAGRAPADAMA